MASSTIGIFEKLRGIRDRGEINEDLQKERDGATFDPMHLTHVLDGGPDRTYRRRYIGQYMYLLLIL